MNVIGMLLLVYILVFFCQCICYYKYIGLVILGSKSEDIYIGCIDVFQFGYVFNCCFELIYFCYYLFGKFQVVLLFEVVYCSLGGSDRAVGM